ncbi:adenosylmethionine--8-amino-7-oxononanoate transaminase [bacterium]|nr:adenosylmethionine--8-amino-7-oxononanoate transaminase [bacterium]
MNLTEKDHRYLWHPFTQMKEWLAKEPVIISAGEGAVLRDTAGSEYLDGNASIWTNLHGHRHPRITAAIKDQLDRIAHSSFLGLANVPAIELAEKLVLLTDCLAGDRPTPQRLTRVFYSDDGSTAVEVAIKMALQYWQHRQQAQRTKFVAFTDAYHGDTIGAVSVGGVGLFHATFQPLLFEVHRIGTVRELEQTLAKHHGRIAAVCLEPLVQGAAGMRLWPRGMLADVRQLCDSFDVLLIADEVLTGFGRTGTMFACEQEQVVPDLLALAKGLTGGYLPLAATLTTAEVFQAFLGEYAEFKTFFHGHSYTGNQLGCAAALASLQVFQEENVLAGLIPKIENLKSGLARCRHLPHVGDVRQLGLIGAVELFQDVDAREPFPLADQMGIKVCREMQQRGVLTRPIGNTIVVLPPYCITSDQLRRLTTVLAESIAAVVGA